MPFENRIALAILEQAFMDFTTRRDMGNNADRLQTQARDAVRGAHRNGFDNVDTDLATFFMSGWFRELAMECNLDPRRITRLLEQRA